MLYFICAASKALFLLTCGGYGMQEQRCSNCGRVFDTDDLLQREDNGQLVCVDCSGLFADDHSSCQYDESG